MSRLGLVMAWCITMTSYRMMSQEYCLDDLAALQYIRLPGSKGGISVKVSPEFWLNCMRSKLSACRTAHLCASITW